MAKALATDKSADTSGQGAVLNTSATGFGVYATGEGMEYYFNGYARCTQAGSGLGGGTGKLATHILPNKVGGHRVGEGGGAGTGGGPSVAAYGVGVVAGIVAGNGSSQRQLKVREAYHSYQLSRNCHQRTPIGEIHLKGHWLIKAGFEIDSPVKVRVMEGCLVLTSEP